MLAVAFPQPPRNEYTPTPPSGVKVALVPVCPVRQLAHAVAPGRKILPRSTAAARQASLPAALARTPTILHPLGLQRESEERGHAGHTGHTNDC